MSDQTYHEETGYEQLMSETFRPNSTPTDLNETNITAQDASGSKLWIGIITKEYNAPGAMNLTLNVGQFVLLTSEEPDNMYTEDGVKWNAYATSWDAAYTIVDGKEIDKPYTSLGWTWLEGMTEDEIIAAYPA